MPGVKLNTIALVWKSLSGNEMSTAVVSPAAECGVGISGLQVGPMIDIREARKNSYN